MGCKEIGIKNSEFKHRTQFLCEKYYIRGFNKILFRPFYLPKLCTLNLHLKHSNFFFMELKILSLNWKYRFKKYFWNMVKIMKCSIHSGTFKHFSWSSSRISYPGTKIDFSCFKIEKWRNLPHCLLDKECHSTQEESIKLCLYSPFKLFNSKYISTLVSALLGMIHVKRSSGWISRLQVFNHYLLTTNYPLLYYGTSPGRLLNS